MLLSKLRVSNKEKKMNINQLTRVVVVVAVDAADIKERTRKMKILTVGGQHAVVVTVDADVW